jgi:SNF2 family DNA or RNA helicase
MLFPKDFRSFHAWVDEHFKITYANYRGKMVKQIGDFLPGHEDIVRAQLSGVIIQRELAELFPGEVWIEEPEHIAIDVELSKAERKIYDSLVEHSWAQTEMRKPIIGSNALSVQTKLRQMSSDWGNIDPDLAIGSKITAAVELIPELAREKPVLVLATYRATCNRLAQALSDKGLRVAVWTGEFTNWQVDGMQYFLDGEYDVVVGTIASLAEGVDGLQYRTNQLVMLDHDWTYAVNEQAIGRLKRQGQSLRTVVYHLYAKDTVDRTVLSANLRKLNVTQTLKGRPLHDVLYGVDDIDLVLEDA